MSETIKVVIEISKDYYEILKCEVEENQTDYYPFIVIGNGIPLDDIDSDETRAYFDGQAYGWEQGRKALIDDVKAEIEKKCDCINSIASYLGYPLRREIEKLLCEILESIGKESEDT